LNHLGANIVIKDLKVSIDIQEPLLIIKKGEQKLVNIHRELEPLENSSVKDKNNFIETRNITMGQLRDIVLYLADCLRVNHISIETISSLFSNYNDNKLLENKS